MKRSTVLGVAAVLAVLVIAEHCRRRGLWKAPPLLREGAARLRGAAGGGLRGASERPLPGFLNDRTPPRYYHNRDPVDGALGQNAVDSQVVGGNDRALSPQRLHDPRQSRSAYESLNTLYSTADVDPLITGQLYEFRDNTRDVYAGRSAVGGAWGLQEFAPDSRPGAVGVDVGPNMLSEYEGSILGYNDGVPEQWAFPSTPFRYYTPSGKADRLTRAGPALADGEASYDLWVPDHEPEIGEEEGPY